MSTIPRGFVVLTNHNAAYPNPRIAVTAIAEYARALDRSWTVVILRTIEDGNSGAYHVTETPEEIDALLCAAQRAAS